MVDVDRPRGVGHARTGFLDRFGRAVAAQFLLDGLHGLKHLERLQVGGDLKRLVRKMLFGIEAPWLAFVTVRTTQHGAHAGVDELLRSLERPFHVARIAAGKKYYTCHKSESFYHFAHRKGKGVNTIVGLPFCEIAQSAFVSPMSGSIFCDPIKGANLVQKASSSPQR